MWSGQGLSAMLESDAAPARTVKATINGEVTIPQHLVQFLETTGEALSVSALAIEWHGRSDRLLIPASCGRSRHFTPPCQLALSSL